MPSILAFGPFHLDPASGQLRRHGRPVRLPPQPSRVLAFLAMRAGEVVTREELRREVWGEQTFVEFEQGLYYCLGRIRAVLGDEGRAPRYVETIPRCGYRFVVPVERLVPPGGASVAVLPFDNLNRREELDYFADGINDALITELGMQPGLRVISRQSVLRFKRSEQGLGDIARQLDVDHVVEGAVLHAGGKVRVSAQLVQAVPERHLWARNVEADAGDVIALQRDIVQGIAREVAAVLAPGAPRPAPGTVTSNPAALESFLRARHCTGRWTAEGFRAGIAFLSEAVALDPAYAAARAELAEVFALVGFWGHMPIAEAYPRAKALALEAIRLDDRLSQAHSALGFALWLLDWDVPGCQRETERAVALNPSNAEALIHSAIFRSVVLRDRRGAEEAARQALRADPLSLPTMTWVAWTFVFTRRFDTAADLARRVLDAFPESLQPYWALGVVHLAQGRALESRAAWEAAVRISGDPVSQAGLAAAAAAAGDVDTARRVLDRILAIRAAGGAESRVSLTRPLVTAWAAVGDMDAAFAEIDRALAARDPVVFFIPVTAAFDPLRADRRFPAFVRRLRRAAGAR